MSEPVGRLAGAESEAEADVDAIELAARLGEAVADSPEHRAFETAAAAVEADDEAQALIAEFEREREAFVRARERGEATRADLRELERLQSEIHEVDVVTDYLAAESALEDLLEDVNEALSAPLAVDFGGEAGGCCME